MKTWVKVCSMVVCGAMVSQAFVATAVAGVQDAPVLPPLLADVNAVPLTDAEAEIIRGEVIPLVAIAIIILKSAATKAAIVKLTAVLVKATPAIIKSAKAFKVAKTAAEARAAVNSFILILKGGGYVSTVNDARQIFNLIK